MGIVRIQQSSYRPDFIAFLYNFMLHKPHCQVILKSLKKKKKIYIDYILNKSTCTWSYIQNKDAEVA